MREIGPDVAGPVGKCTRCPPYRLELGDRNTLVLHHGVFRVRHDATTWESAGHYLVEGGRVTFFNDPNCPTVRGVYRWREAGGALSLATVDDDCAFDGLRERYLTATAWSREPTGA